MEGATRTRLVALAVLLAVGVPLVIVALAGSSGEEDSRPPGGLRVEQTAAGLAEITVYVEDRALNKANTAGGAREVDVQCVDRGGELVFAKTEPWPFADTDGGTLDPHAHVGVDVEQLERITRCRLEGTDPPLEGRLL